VVSHFPKRSDKCFVTQKKSPREIHVHWYN